MSTKIYHIDKINTDNIDFLKGNAISGNIIVPIYYKTKTKNPLIIQLFDVKIRNYTSNKLIIQLENDNLDFLSTLDTLIQSRLKKIIIQLKTSRMFNTNTKNISYDAIIKTLDNNDEDKFAMLQMTDSCKVYNDDKKLIEKDEYETVLSSDVSAKLIIEVNSIVFDKEEISVNLKLHQIKITEANAPMLELNLNTYAFSDSETESESLSDSEAAC